MKKLLILLVVVVLGVVITKKLQETNDQLNVGVGRLGPRVGPFVAVRERDRVASPHRS